MENGFYVYGRWGQDWISGYWLEATEQFGQKKLVAVEYGSGSGERVDR